MRPARRSTPSSKHAHRPRSHAGSFVAKPILILASFSAPRQNDSCVTGASAHTPTAQRPRARTRLDRVLSAIPIIALTVTVLVFYAVEAWTRRTPWIFTDEMEWT